jgi:zinc-ribbon domain
MFCQKCGASAPDQTKFCKQCGHSLKPEPRISNKAMLVAAIAAIASIGTSLLAFLPRDNSIKARDAPTPTVTITSSSGAPSPRTSPTPKPTQKPRQTPEPISDYSYKHTPMLEYPPDGVLFSYIYSSGKIIFRWRPSEATEADRYKVIFEYGNPDQWHRRREIETPWNYCTGEFVGAQTEEFVGRWRVTPIFADGRSGMPTEWRTFRFTR